MKNRIRHYRRQRHMTLKELAEAIGTTPQTVSRLETEVMTLSADWLERLGQALDVHASDLLGSPNRPDIPLLGLLSANGTLMHAVQGESLILDIQEQQPVAVRMAQAYGPFRTGEVLVGRRLEGAQMEIGLGHICLCCMADGHIVLRRVTRGMGGSYTLVPLGNDTEVRYNQNLQWIGRLLLRLEYL